MVVLPILSWADMSKKISETCTFCGSSDLFPKRQTVAGDRVAVCKICSSCGRAALDAELAAGTPPDRCGSFLGCLHMAAMELEREMSARSHHLGRRERRSLRAIESSFARSAFRLACACQACSDWQNGVDAGPVIFTDLFESEDEAAGLGLGPMPEAEWLATYGPPIDSCGVAREVQPPEGFMAFGSIAARVATQRAAKDAASWQHWHMVQKYGAGIRDGDFWLARDGRVVPLQDADRVLPMTEADKRALAEDQRRAAIWRGSVK